MKSAVNLLVDIVNKFVEGINWVLEKIPGIGGGVIPKIGHWDGDIPFFAQGGMLPSSKVGGGFVTNGARAIVGEGNRSHPEYVIPTDPNYRDRALKLLFALTKELGMASGGVIPAYGIGGIIGSVGTAFTMLAVLGGPAGDDYDLAAQLWIQVKSVGVAIVWSAVGAAIAFTVAKVVTGGRVTPEVEREGLDLGEHGERAYNY